MSPDTNIIQIEERLIDLQGHKVLIDRDVASFYGVVTRDINKAVKNNPDKLPSGYIIELDALEKKELVENFHRFNGLKHTKINPKAFTEKGLYMLATILKSKKATQTTFLIIETFAILRSLQQTVAAAATSKGNQKNNLLKRSG